MSSVIYAIGAHLAGNAAVKARLLLPLHYYKDAADAGHGAGVQFRAEGKNVACRGWYLFPTSC